MRIALASALVLSALRAAGAEPCAVRAEVKGDPAAVATVVAELARLGVEHGAPAPGCRGVLAQVEFADEGLAVAIRDGSRRSEGRVVSDAAVAATWIDSWLRDDLDGTAWLVATPAVPRVNPPIVVARRVAPPPPPPGDPLVERLSVMAGYEWTHSGEPANGLTIASCLRLGDVCLGARARYARDADRMVDLAAMSRSDASLLATASIALPAGRMQAVPELGLGIGRRSTSRTDDCGCMPGDPMISNCPPDPNTPPMPCTDPSGKTIVGDKFATATWTPRLAAAMRIAIPIFDHVWLDGLASVSLAPFGHGDPFIRPSGIVSPDGTMSAEVEIPGEPLTGVHLGVGLRIGAP